jgi:hypothetical protein
MNKFLIGKATNKELLQAHSPVCLRPTRSIVIATASSLASSFTIVFIKLVKQQGKMEVTL